jgi:hypothetical protein
MTITWFGKSEREKSLGTKEKEISGHGSTFLETSFVNGIVLHTLVAGCWLEASIRKVLRPATSAQVFLAFPVSISEC